MHRKDHARTIALVAAKAAVAAQAGSAQSVAWLVNTRADAHAAPSRRAGAARSTVRDRNPR